MEIKIFCYVNSNIFYSGKEINLSNDIKQDIYRNWQKISKSKDLYNGELFTINNINYSLSGLTILADSTTYDHYIYGVHNYLIEEHRCKSIAANVLLRTIDGYYILAIMGNKTALSNKIKFIGGSVSNEDVFENKIILENCVIRETYEEIGVDLTDKTLVKNVSPKYIITRDNFSFFNLLFISDLKIKSTDIIKIFENHKEKLRNKNEKSELSNILLLKDDVYDIKKFLSNYQNNIIDYMDVFWNIQCGRRKFDNIENEFQN